MIEYDNGSQRVDPSDISHWKRRMESLQAEDRRRYAMLEKRILVLEGKRQAGRADDLAEIASFEPSPEPSRAVTIVPPVPPTEGDTSPRKGTSEYERDKKRRQRERQRGEQLG